jgi:PEP-CTERM motif
MKKLITICAVVMMILVLSGVAQAALQTYSIVDYPAWQLDTMTGLTDHVSGTITADPTTGIIDSASFTITGATSSYTVASATPTTPYYIVVTPTEITLSLAAPDGFLKLSGSTGVSGINNTAMLSWYTPANPWVVGTNDWQGYTGQVGSHGSGPYFAGGPVLPDKSYYQWVVATAVPEPATMCLLGLGALSLIRRKG